MKILEIIEARNVAYIEDPPFGSPGEVLENPTRREVRSIGPHVRFLLYDGDNPGLVVWDANLMIHTDIYVDYFGKDEMDVPGEEWIGGQYFAKSNSVLFDGDFGGDNRDTYDQDVERLARNPFFREAFGRVEFKRS